MAVDPELLKILVCPKTKGPLELIDLPAPVRMKLVEKYREKFRDEQPVVTSGLARSRRACRAPSSTSTARS